MKFMAFVFSVLVLSGNVGAQQILKFSRTDAAPFLKDAEKMPSAAVFLGTSGNFEQAIIEPVNNILYAVVREEMLGKSTAIGHLVAIDIESEHLLWKVPFAGPEATLVMHDTLPMMLFSNYSGAFSPADGHSVWRRNMRVRQLIPHLGIAIAAGHEHGNGFVTAFDLTTGDTKWRYQSRALRSFDNMFLSGDTIITCISSSLHQIDLRTGEGFFMPLKYRASEVDDGSAAVVAFWFGLAGVLVYYALTPNQFRTTIGSELHNTLVYNGTTYDATSKTIAALQQPGRIVWEYAVPYSVVGSAKLFEKNGSLYAVYPGILSSPTSDIEGTAIVVRLDPATGKELAFAWLSQAKQQNISDFMVSDTTILVAMNNKMVLLDLHTLKPISSKLFGDARMGAGLDKIVRPPYFTLSENRINKESETQWDKLYIQNTSGMKIEFSSTFEPVAVVPKARFFSFAGQAGPYSAYTNSVRSVITGSDGVVLPIGFTSNFQMNDTYVWDWNGKALVVIPVSGIQ